MGPLLRRQWIYHHYLPYEQQKDGPELKVTLPSYQRLRALACKPEFEAFISSK